MHIVACAWFWLADYNGFEPMCWVVRENQLEASVFDQYVSACYWAFQTLCTVGYGDIPAVTLYEKFFAIMWMIGGFGFYSYTIGNFQSILNEIDARAYQKQIKLDTMLEFSQRTGLPHSLQKDLQRFINNNALNEDILELEMHTLLDELPLSVKGVIARHSYRDIIQTIWFFNDKPNEFIWYFLPKLKQMNFFAGEKLFIQQEHAEEVYFIMKGKVKLVYDLTEGQIDQPYHIPFNMYVAGSYFGDSDVLADTNNEGRDGTAIVDSESVIYVITRRDLLSVMKHFKNTYSKEMNFIAKERRQHHKEAIEELKLQN